MELREIKTEASHCFVDTSGNKQGEYKRWWDNGQLHIHCHFKDDKSHGEHKEWHSGGQLCEHTLDMNCKEVIDFLATPNEYPTTPEDRLLFKLKYGTAPFLDEL